MTLRLVLVSLVAALGLTIPGAPMIESWVASTQNWMNARFADWDTRNPQIADYVIVSDSYDVERLAPRPAISSLPVAMPTRSSVPQEQPTLESAAAANALPSEAQMVLAAHVTHVRPASFVRKVAVFEPIALSETLCLSFAEELNRRNEGVNIVPARHTHAQALQPRVELSLMTSSFYRGIASLMVQWSKITASLPPRVVSPSPAKRRIEPMMVFENLYGCVAPRKTTKPELAQAKPVTPKPVVVQAKPVTPKPEVAQAKPVTPKPVVVQAKPVTPKPEVAQAKPLTPKPVPTAVAAPAKVQSQATRPVTTLATSFGAMESSPSLYFSGVLSMPAKTVVSALLAPPTAPKPKSAPKPVVKAVPPATPKATAVAVGPKPDNPPARPQETIHDLDIEVAEALLPLDDGFGVFAPATARKAPAPAPVVRFEPLKVGSQLSVGIAHELNRRNEGLQLSAPAFPTAPRVATSTPHPTRELNRAVKLTRDAVYAWVNVFTGPALVTVSQSKDQPLGR